MLVFDLLDSSPHASVVKVDFFQVVTGRKYILTAYSLPWTKDASYDFFLGPLYMDWCFWLAGVPDSKWVVFRSRGKNVLTFWTVKREASDRTCMCAIVLNAAHCLALCCIVQSHSVVSSSRKQFISCLVPFDTIRCVFGSFTAPVDRICSHRICFEFGPCVWFHLPG